MAVRVKEGPADQGYLIEQIDEAICTLQELERHVCYARKVNPQLQDKWDTALADLTRLDELLFGEGRESLSDDQQADLDHFLDYAEGRI